MQALLFLLSSRLLAPALRLSSVRCSGGCADAGAALCVSHRFLSDSVVRAAWNARVNARGAAACWNVRVCEADADLALGWWELLQVE